MNIKKYLDTSVKAAVGIALAIIAWMRLSSHHDLLYEAQDHSYWQPGMQFFHEICQYPGGLFSWAGCYLTQYFYHPTVGILLLIGIWSCIYLLLVTGCRLRWWACWIAALPVLLLLWAETSAGYYLYTLKLPDWWFTPTLFVWAVALVMFLGRPLATLLGKLWPRLLTPWTTWSWQALWLVVALVSANRWLQEANVPKALQKPFATACTDQNLRHQMLMRRAAERGDWPQVLSEIRHSSGLINREMLVWKTVALYHQDQLLEHWLDYPVMGQMPEGYDQHQVRLVEMGGPWLYFYQGCIEFAYRWCMENTVEYGPSMQRLRLMTLCALANGEDQLARKYLDLLDNTRYHHEWAEEHRQYVGHQEAMANDPRYARAIAASQHVYNLLDSDNTLCEKYLIEHFSTTPCRDNPVLSPLCLAYAMQTQNIDDFWPQFFTYTQLHQSEHLPRSCQEAAFLYGQLEPYKVDVSRMPFDDEVPATFQRFMQTSQQLLKNGMTEENVGRAMQREFGHTFFWFYYFCRKQKLY